MIQIQINNQVIRAKVANDPTSIKQGMMGKKFDETFNGMLFVVGSKYTPDPYNYTSVPVNNEQYFWMKNCIIPLDVVFIQDNKITRIHHECPPCLSDNCKTYSGFADLVLEVEGGTCKKKGIREGDFVIV